MRSHGDRDAFNALFNKRMECHEKYVIPVAWHVIYSTTGEGKVEKETLAKQVKVLNGERLRGVGWGGVMTDAVLLECTLLINIGFDAVSTKMHNRCCTFVCLRVNRFLVGTLLNLCGRENVFFLWFQMLLETHP
jgi:hypothetical protein